ncbi:hypothetical protein N7478_002717 [Penicillium angulare]|uniref:uncharacterized protein n=1 Tax=Penicillium angulare TaxID=116970 RepID=UPI0025404311|nr:uncharacterized protein N7478_002717 [Penicillium angulare]KAJ5287031.1 hypothetical protein N7478_002717 [Penicillium angulare]
MPAPSLLQLATSTAIKHVKLLNDVGNLPYALVRPILLKVDNPEKLHSMEQLSPHLADEDQEIWLEFIRRDIPQWDRYELPKSTNKWYEIYCDLQEDVQRALDADAEKMKMALDGIKSERTRLTPKIIAGPKGKSTRSFRPGPGIRSEPRKPTIFTPQRRNNALAIPTKHLTNRATQVRRAPRSLIEVHRRPTDPPVPSAPGSALTASKRVDKDARAPVAPGRLNQHPSSSSLAEREARLRAIASGNPLPSSSTNTIRKVPIPSRHASSPAKQPNLKRSATSPPPSANSGGTSSSARASDKPPAQSNSVTTTAPRPAMPRKRPDSVFIQPKRRRIT